MPRSQAEKRDGPKVDYDRLWAEAEAERKKGEQTRRIAWRRWAKEHGSDAPYSSWLVIPYSLNDYGLRPFDPNTTVFWASPFVGVRSPDPSGRPRAGVENYLTAGIFNFGAATAAPTKVDFYVKEPSLGLGAGDPNVFEARAEDFHDQWIEVQPMRPGGPPGLQFLQCSKPWIPSYDFDGHECAFVICDNHILDSAPRHPFEPWNDRRVGQCNLFVLPAVEHAFHLWAPFGDVVAPAEVRMLALRGIAPEGFVRGANDYATLTRATHEVLRGLRASPTTARTEADRSRRPIVFAEAMPVERMLRGAKLLDARRAVCGGHASCPDGQAAPLAGEVILRLPAAPGTAGKLQLDLQPLDLARNEIVVLNVFRVALGRVTGGYTIALANPTWFKTSASAPKGGGVMKDPNVPKGKGLKALVIEHNPQAKITYELACQLERFLPIADSERLKDSVGELTLNGQRLPFDFFAPFLTKALFPIQDVEDLVKKLSAATSFALEVAARSSSGDEGKTAALRTLLSGNLEGVFAKRAPATVAYATRASAAGQALFNSANTKGGY